MADQPEPSGPAALTRHAHRLDAAVRAQVGRGLRSRGWSPAVVGYPGYGGPGWVRVLARVLLDPPGVSERPEDRRGWRRFVSPSAAQVPVRVGVGGQEHLLVSGPDGHIDARVPCDLPPGWGTVSLRVDGGEPVEAPVRIVGPDTRLGMVSDLDDTVIVTNLPRPLLAFRNAFLLRESDRRPVTGMSALYREIVESHPDVFVVYVSTGAWNTAEPMGRFLARHGYPAGPLLLTDWGPTQDSWFRSGPEHKRTQLRRLFTELPWLRWLLVGDDGQHDPSLYAEAVADHPHAVLGVAIRQLSAAEHVAGHGTPVPKDGVHLSRQLPGRPVQAPDGFGLREELRRRRLVLDRP